MCVFNLLAQDINIEIVGIKQGLVFGSSVWMEVFGLDRVIEQTRKFRSRFVSPAAALRSSHFSLNRLVADKS